MAYLLHHFWTAGTEDQYRAMLKAVHPATGLPEGQTHHIAGPTDGGFLITSVWDSRASSDRFVEDLKAKMPVEGGFDGPLEERGADVANFQSS